MIDPQYLTDKNNYDLNALKEGFILIRDIIEESIENEESVENTLNNTNPEQTIVTEEETNQ